MPDAEDPKPPEPEPQEEATKATDISYEEFNEYADQFFEELQGRLEDMQEAENGLEVEYAAGVMTIEIPTKGTYVLNKQPPNKQIWLSSPISGPKRFDWVVFGESMDQKEGGGTGDWIYLRDGSSLTQILRKEIGVEVGMTPDVE
ncbi:Mitochondrial matrix iron chaperone [Coniosporium apollinis]|uniref:ferroxidase n=2 Tax=Coniosporium TaxID=2810619 RepID=A0ABQ9NRY8_9PEZI|nr:Mitochondrial matrix iron chaperone [Cladosporium sp. JES 115]KAJ9664917.1 Mitochondrial matrix iron chaperone [Coniosporium apollinis]